MIAQSKLFMSLLQHTLKVNLVAAAKGSRCFATGMSDG
jgi:hypothetical protein